MEDKQNYTEDELVLDENIKVEDETSDNTSNTDELALNETSNAEEVTSNSDNVDVADDHRKGSVVYEDIDFDAIMKKKGVARFFKRCFDIIASSLGLIFLILPFLIIAIAIRCSSKGPVYFRQKRVGKDGKEFRIYKFRTMVVDAESRGKQITVGDDVRITGIGKFLRKTKLDELPQLINVLIGDMSFVGPRPEVPKYVAMYNDYERNILRIKPGITELASITYRDENEVLAASEDPEDTYINEIMPTKLALNMQYMKKMNVFYDIALIFKTFAAILK